MGSRAVITVNPLATGGMVRTIMFCY